MAALNGPWPVPDWHDPLVLGLVAVVVLLALWRRWSFVLLAALIVALGQGLDYLLRNAAFGAQTSRAVVTAIYLVGAAFLVFLAIARVVTKR